MWHNLLGFYDLIMSSPMRKELIKLAWLLWAGKL